MFGISILPTLEITNFFKISLKKKKNSSKSPNVFLFCYSFYFLLNGTDLYYLLYIYVYLNDLLKLLFTCEYYKGLLH